MVPVSLFGCSLGCCISSNVNDPGTLNDLIPSVEVDVDDVCLDNFGSGKFKWFYKDDVDSLLLFVFTDDDDDDEDG